VVIPVMTQHYAMLQRNLLYTGVTRGKRLVVRVGQKKAVAIAVRNVSGRRRWSKLAEWLSADVSKHYVSRASLCRHGEQVNCVVSSMQMSALRPAADGSLRRNKWPSAEVELGSTRPIARPLQNKFQDQRKRGEPFCSVNDGGGFYRLLGRNRRSQ
jgi:UvrD-like helicase C-terminal domain